MIGRDREASCAQNFKGCMDEEAVRKEEETMRAFREERSSNVRYQDFFATTNRIYRLAEIRGQGKISRVMDIIKEVIALLSDYRLPVLEGTGVIGMESGFIANPNQGHASRRGMSKRAKSAGENRSRWRSKYKKRNKYPVDKDSKGGTSLRKQRTRFQDIEGFKSRLSLDETSTQPLNDASPSGASISRSLKK